MQIIITSLFILLGSFTIFGSPLSDEPNIAQQETKAFLPIFAGQTSAHGQDVSCTYSLSRTRAGFGTNGGEGYFEVTTGVGCPIVATSNEGFIIVTGATGSGSGIVFYTVLPGSGERTGTINVNGQIFTVFQSVGCNPVLSLNNSNFTPAGGIGSVNVAIGAGCDYRVSSNDPSITFITGSGTGTGIVTFSIAPNPGFRRFITLTVNNVSTTITQLGECIISITSPVNAYFGREGGTGSFAVSTGVGCTYQAATVYPFITTTNGTSTGSGTVTFTVAPNTGAARTGVVSFYNGSDTGDVRFTVIQSSSNYNRTAFDFDGDARSDMSVFRPDTGTWYLLNSTAGFTGFQFGFGTDLPVPADYDGDGRTDVAVYRSGTWYVQRSSQGFLGIQYGAATDIPVPADYDGDGRSEFAVYRPSNGTWYLYNLATNQTSSVSFGVAEDKPVVGDYNGDGKADIAVFRPSSGTWYTSTDPATNYGAIVFGNSEDRVVPADYDGDGKTDVAVFRPSNGTWYLQRSQFGFTGIAFGFGTDSPTPGDYDGDGKADVAVFREGIWYIRRSGRGLLTVQFGSSTDKPIPNAYVR